MNVKNIEIYNRYLKYIFFPEIYCVLDMDTVTAFVNDIIDYNFTFPYWFKVSILIIFIIILTVAAYFLKEQFETTYLRSGFVWFMFIAIINLTTMLIIYVYYNRKVEKVVGVPGKKGKRGKKGKIGISTSCGYCTNNIFIQTVHRTDLICMLGNLTYQPTANVASSVISGLDSIMVKYKYFENYLDKGFNIDYNSFINNIIFEKPLTRDVNKTAINNFTTLMEPIHISGFLISNMNKQISASSNEIYGSFRNPVPKVGYVSLGNSVYGGSEDFQLNSFVVSGNIMYPSAFDKLVTFESYDLRTNELNKFTIWRPISQKVNDKNYKNELEQSEFTSLGDICFQGVDNPNLNDYALLKDTCLEQVSINDLKLIFIYWGPLDWASETTDKLDYTKTESYLIETRMPNNMQFFSVWRTPMNTFVTNCNFYNDLQNNTVIYNLYNGIDEVLNEYGNISDKYRTLLINKLTSINMPQILTALILCKYFSLEYRKELIYYINKYSFKIPEFQNANLNSKTFGQLYELVNQVNKQYIKFNDELVKKASVSLSSENPIIYDEKKEKHLPPLLLQLFNSSRDVINGIPVQIENTYTLYDIVNIVLPNGLDSRIAINSDGITEGGIFLNEIQEMIVRLCKIILPPNKPVYNIKDECLGTFTIDKKRQEKIKELVEQRENYNKYVDIILNDQNKYKNQMNIFRQYIDLAETKIGQLCSHIPDYMNKIRNFDLDEFTTSRIEGLINIYSEINEYFIKIIDTSL